MRTKVKQPEPVAHASLICEGEYWTLAFEARLVRLRDSKGLRQLALLLHEPGREFHVLDLGPRIDPGEIDSSASRIDPEGLAKLTVHSSLSGDGGDLLDAQAVAALKQRRVELTEELEEAREFQDQERVARIEDEIDQIEGVLKGALGLSGRSRKAGSAAEQARVNVTRNIGRALDQIEAKHESLGRFLKSTIKTGIFCSYQPDSRYPVAWRLEAEQSSDAISSAESDQRSVGSAPDLHRELAGPAGRGEARLAEGLKMPPTASQLEHLGRQTAAAVATKSDDLQIRLADKSAPENVEGERKTVTALLADFKGSMGLIEDLDPEELRAIVDPALKLMIDAVNHYDGYVTRSTDDGIFALFGAPVAHEDHPRRALSAALRMQAEVKRYAEKLRAEKGLNVQVRVGANTGEVVMRQIRTGEKHTEYGPIGHSISVAAGVQMMAAPGSIVITESVRKLVEGFFTLKSLGPTRIHGVSEPLEIYEVTGPGPLRTHFQLSARRGWTRFVGRETEMEAIARAAGLARSGHGQIVAVVAEPGVGKSRLFYEFKVRNQSAWMTLEAYSISHGKTSAYLPVIDLLHSYFVIAPEEDARTRREKVMNRLLALDSALQETFPYLFRLLEIIEGDDPLAQMDSQIRRRRTLDAIKRILLRESLNQPLMVTFEDLHWTDGETLAFLNLLADSIGTARVLLLVNYRPEHRHDWGNKSYYTQLGLNPLRKDSADEMLSALLGEGRDLMPLKGVITQKTEGNPFFIEEIVQALFEQGVLARNGTVKLAKAISEIRIPATVQGVLASRIDRLPPDLKELLQTLAVIGKEFAITLVREVTAKAEEELERPLADLQLAEFIYERPALPHTTYTFKHALSRDVAYDSVLIERRKLLHERTGAAIEALYRDRLDDHLGALAHHYSHSRDTRKAVRYLRLAGAQAAQRPANREAVAYFRGALDLLKLFPDSSNREREELDILVMLGPALMALAGYAAPEPEAVYVRARELCRQLGDNTRLFPVLWGLWIHSSSGGDLNNARMTADELMILAERLGDDTSKLQAHHASWTTLYDRGELKACRLHTERGLALYNPREHQALASVYGGHDPGVCGRSHAAFVLWLLGYPDRALESSREALALAQELAHPHGLAHALWGTAITDQLRGDHARVRERAETMIALAAEHRFPQWVAVGTILRCWAVGGAVTSQLDIANMRQAVAAFRASGMGWGVSYYLALTAETCARLQRIGEARELIAEALDLMRRTGQRWYEAELHRLTGEFSLMAAAPAESGSEEHFRHAIDVAREAESKSLELRGVMSLARMFARQGKRDEARAIVADIYNWFTEGFDTADLKDAKALLEELSS